jgi:replicative DNA helicase
LFELEMSKEDLVERILSQLSLVDHVRLRAGKLEAHHTKRMGDAAHLLSTAKLFIDDNPNLSASDLRTKCRRLVKQHGPGVIIVDYLQLMTIPGDNRNEGVGKVSRAAKLLARELECPVIMLSQLSRGPESREDKRPRLSDLRDSGSIEQDADNVIFLYRPEVYYGKVDSAGNELEGAAELIVGKQRNGPIGIVKTNFSKRLMLFHEPNNEPTQDR